MINRTLCRLESICRRAESAKMLGTCCNVPVVFNNVQHESSLTMTSRLTPERTTVRIASISPSEPHPPPQLPMADETGPPHGGIPWLPVCGRERSRLSSAGRVSLRIHYSGHQRLWPWSRQTKLPISPAGGCMLFPEKPLVPVTELPSHPDHQVSPAVARIPERSSSEPVSTAGASTRPAAKERAREVIPDCLP